MASQSNPNHAKASHPEGPTDRHLRAMVDHALAWMPFGGADDQIFLEFGTTPGAFYRRIAIELDRSASLQHLAPRQRKDLHRFCRRKLWHYHRAPRSRASPVGFPT
ncbi:hypothetical protein [Gordonia rhizosphera]|uniref:DUF3263 domain-containing protein n=1 Tax=Gordonia rhizosphera NBRC 16068 TaxID=1108045 RepID=K6WFE6_9ACTN|nr:hypothetical protein [Gordonia rhizosphera]GAB92486.1 hypothetical protein GORHZ_181_00030 [Gordonia rhizosphera NBRC 16068]